VLSIVAAAQEPARLENMQGTTLMLFTPRPHDDTFRRMHEEE
jgi:hypothetical protein